MLFRSEVKILELSFALSGRLKGLKLLGCGFVGSQLSRICMYYHPEINRGM